MPSGALNSWPHDFITSEIHSKNDLQCTFFTAAIHKPIMKLLLEGAEEIGVYKKLYKSKSISITVINNGTHSVGSRSVHFFIDFRLNMQRWHAARTRTVRMVRMIGVQEEKKLVLLHSVEACARLW